MLNVFHQGFEKCCLLLGCYIRRTATQCPNLKTAASDIRLTKFNKAKFDCVIDLGEQPEATGENMSQAKHQDDTAKSSTNTSHMLALVCLLTSLLLTAFITYFFTYRNRNAQPQLRRSGPKTCPICHPLSNIQETVNYSKIDWEKTEQLRCGPPSSQLATCPVDAVLNYQNIQFLPPNSPVPVPYNNPYQNIQFLPPNSPVPVPYNNPYRFVGRLCHSAFQ